RRGFYAASLGGPFVPALSAAGRAYEQGKAGRHDIRKHRGRRRVPGPAARVGERGAGGPGGRDGPVLRAGDGAPPGGDPARGLQAVAAQTAPRDEPPPPERPAHDPPAAVCRTPARGAL